MCDINASLADLYEVKSDGSPGKAEPAVADHGGRDPVPARQGAVGIPEQLRVVVRVQVDETRSDDEAVGIQHLRARVGIDMADLRDDAGSNADIRPVAGNPRSIDDGSLLDDDIEFRQRISL
jgi:hypothetical protein